eukprot:3517421-Rhodomonas_salina.2
MGAMGSIKHFGEARQCGSAKKSGGLGGVTRQSPARKVAVVEREMASGVGLEGARAALEERGGARE